jgi:hypothetical protein
MESQLSPIELEDKRVKDITEKISEIITDLQLNGYSTEIPKSRAMVILKLEEAQLWLTRLFVREE